MNDAVRLRDTDSDPRALLRRLHAVMASEAGAEGRLAQVVREIADVMRVQVCSVYILAPDGFLELFATEGLRLEAVHRTRLAIGEGLVGAIADSAAPLNLAEAREHPNFVYRPETGEELYHSFCGVPIMRAGQPIGVLSIQTVEPRSFAAEEVEVLQTVAMVLAELLGAGGLAESALAARQRLLPRETQVLAGVRLVDGVAFGDAVFHQPRVEVVHTVADDVEREKIRIREAFRTMRAQIDRMMAASDIGHAGEHRDILETYKMFAFDRGWGERIDAAIESGLTAEAAVERVQQRTRASMQKTQDPYLLERLHDLDDLANRLIRIVAGQLGSAAAQGLTGDSVLFARSLGPAELLEYDRKYLKGLVLEEGSPTAHVTIVARAMGIPVVGRVKGVLDIVQPGDTVVVDAEAAQVCVRPSADVLRGYEQAVALKQARALRYAEIKDLPSVTRDGVAIKLMMNAGLKADLSALDATNAEGIGLFRTEFQFMVSATVPRVEAQTALYREVMDAAGERPVNFRAIDIGGDKRLPYIDGDAEENPAMGWRALRVALDRPVLMKLQLRALIRAAAGRPLNLMFPMVAEVAEFEAAHAMVEHVIAFAKRVGWPLPSRLRLGVMLEVPSLAWQLDTLLPRIDFLAIGTNDLLQFFFAADRSHPKLADRYDLLSPAALSFIRSVVKACDAHGVEVSVCGEVGGRPLEAMVLIGLGLRRLSMSPAAIGPVKLMVRSLDCRVLAQFVETMLGTPDHSIRRYALDFANRHNVPA
ncbi:MAG: phosphoenolpyruvate--protein phosphotransferase [Alphaproteobacteria bacterium]|nr:MAG: phosphoenolpyruvate--protein phosphotransferase [Alphaproteobacteria bacterium]